MVPYLYLPLLLIAALINRAYDDTNAIVKIELGKSSFASNCTQSIVVNLPNVFIALALSLNLAMWLDFVFSSLYSIQRKFDAYNRFRRKLLRILTIFSILVVLLPAVLLAYFECKDILFEHMSIYVCVIYSFFAIVTSIVGVSLLRILKSYFSDFYGAVHVRTTAIIVCQGVAFLIRALFSIFRYLFSVEFLKWFEKSVRNDTYGAPGYLLA